MRGWTGGQSGRGGMHATGMPYSLALPSKVNRGPKRHGGACTPVAAQLLTDSLQFSPPSNPSCLHPGEQGVNGPAGRAAKGASHRHPAPHLRVVREGNMGALMRRHWQGAFAGASRLELATTPNSAICHVSNSSQAKRVHSSAARPAPPASPTRQATSHRLQRMY